MRKLLPILAVGCLLTSPSWSQDRAEPRCVATPDASILTPAQLTQLELATQIGEAETGSVKLAGPLAGVVIDASCFKADSQGKPSLEERAFRRRRIEAGLNRMLERFATCDAFLKLPDLAGAKSVLTNTQIFCSSDAPANVVGKASVAPLEISPGMKRAPGSSAEAPLKVTLNTALDSPGNYLDSGKLNLENSSYRWSIDNLASILGHEILHGTSNSTTWHTQNQDDQYEQTGCNNSLYTDRIYGITAICFPHSESGLAYFDPKVGASKCPTVCEKALGSVDVDLYENFKVDAGPSSIAQPLPAAEATERCVKIQKLSQYVTGRAETLTAIRKKIRDLQTLLIEQEPPQKEWSVLTRRTSFLNNWVYLLKEGYEKSSDARAVLKKERDILRLARSPQATELIRILDEIEKWVDSPLPDGIDLFAHSLNSSENPKLP